jgi:hypothetical protein
MPAKSAMAGIQVDTVEQLAVDVELCLARRGVADPHRLGPAIAIEMRQTLLWGVALAADAIQNLELRGWARAGALQKVHEVMGFPVVPEVHQRHEGEGGVAHPRKAIIAIPHAADRFGQRRGRGSHDGAHRLKGQQLQRQGATQHDIAIGTLVRACLRPLLPIRACLLQHPLRDIEVKGRDLCIAFRIRQHEGHDIACAQPKRGRDLSSALNPWARAVDVQGVVAALKEDFSPFGWNDFRWFRGEGKGRLNLEREFNGTASTADIRELPLHQLAFRSGSA